MSLDCGTNLADILNNVLPPDKRAHEKEKTISDNNVRVHNRANRKICSKIDVYSFSLRFQFTALQNGSGEVSESASTSSLGSNSSHNKAPGAQLHNSNSNSNSNHSSNQSKMGNLICNPSLLQVVSQCS